jgi:hypothetical protein
MLADHALDSIAVHRPPYLSGDKDAKQEFGADCFPDLDLKMRKGEFPGHELFFRNSDGQPLSAFLAATPQNLPPTGTAHSFPEAVCPQTPLFMGLEGSLHV